MNTHRILAALAALLSPLAAQQNLQLTTTYGGNLVSSSAQYFDLDVKVGVRLVGIDANVVDVLGGTLAATGLDVYVRPGTFVGSTASNAGWALAARGGSSALSAPGTPTSYPFAAPLDLTPGRYGIALVYTGGALAIESRGTNVGVLAASTAEMDLFEGDSFLLAFAGTAGLPMTFNGSINYQRLQGFASTRPFGAGCGGSTGFASFYERFTPGTFDLAGTPGAETVIQLNPASPGFIGLPSRGAWNVPTSPDLAIATLGNSGPIALPFAFPFLGGTVQQIWIDGNGSISLQPPVPNGQGSSSTSLLQEEARLAPFWTGLDPTSGGSIHFDVDPSGNAVYVTWLSVPPFTAGILGTSTFQCALFATGQIEYRYRQAANNGLDDVIVGLSPGNGALDPGSIDISAAVPIVTTRDVQVPDLGLVTERPVEGTTMNITIDDIDPRSVLGALLISPTSVLPGVPALPNSTNCLRYVGTDEVFYFAAVAPTVVVPAAIPAGPFTGRSLFLQAVTLTPGFAPNQVITSNAVELAIDVN